MNCFRHQHRVAVGVCKVCGKALCPDCLAELPEGIVCRGECEERLAAVPAAGPAGVAYRAVRKRSKATILGWPLYDIAVGPDPSRGQLRGHARGVIAIGDTARGGLAIGGVAVGIVALGGLAVGGMALGGAAMGGIALGGGALGYCAIGGGAFGRYVIDGARRSPELLELLSSWSSWFGR